MQVLCAFVYSLAGLADLVIIVEAVEKRACLCNMLILCALMRNCCVNK
jgi:hypothetical protein